MWCRVCMIIRVPSVKTSIIVLKELVEQLWPHRCSDCDVKYSGWDTRYIRFVFMKHYVSYHIYWIWCDKYTGCDVILIWVWCHNAFMWCHAKWMWCHNIECNVIQLVGEIQLVHWAWWHRYSGCSVRYRGWDGRYNFCVVMCLTSYIVCVMSWMQWM